MRTVILIYVTKKQVFDFIKKELEQNEFELYQKLKTKFEQ